MDFVWYLVRQLALEKGSHHLSCRMVVLKPKLEPFKGLFVYILPVANDNLPQLQILILSTHKWYPQV